MKAVAAFLLVLCYLAISHAWTCKEGPRLYSVTQVDAGQGKVVATAGYYAYFLIGSTWYRMSNTRVKHVSVGPSGLWAASYSNRVYKYIAGYLHQASTNVYMLQVDAGGDDQVVGITNYYYAYCLKSTLASTYKGVGSLSLSYLSKVMRYYSCGPLYGCWGVDKYYRVFHTQKMYPASCGTSGWALVKGYNMNMIEVGTDGKVFGVTTKGLVYERTGISSKYPQGTGWVAVSICLPARHVSYDLGRLWVVTKTGTLMRCTR